MYIHIHFSNMAYFCFFFFFFFFFLQMHSNVSTITIMIQNNTISPKNSLTLSLCTILNSSSHPQPLATTDLSPTPTVLPFPECQINRIIQYQPFGSGFLKSAKSICDFANSNSSLSFIVEYYDPEYGYTIGHFIIF